jgi:hypothetical protein
MRTISEIQRRIAVLKAAQNSPCNCQASGHEQDCYKGFLMLKATWLELEWVLGSNEMLPMHQEMEAIVKRLIAEKN